MIVVPFISTHLEGFDLQEDQIFMNKYMMDPDYIKQIGELSEAYSGIIDGKVYAVAGVFKPHDHLGMVWALLSKDANMYLTSITKRIKSWLDAETTPRLETAVRRDFEQGHRWAKMLGFVNETPEYGMKKYGIDGSTCDLYSRIL